MGAAPYEGQAGCERERKTEDGEELPLFDGQNVHEPELPGVVGQNVQESEPPRPDGQHVQESALPRSDGQHVQESALPGTEGQSAQGSELSASATQNARGSDCTELAGFAAEEPLECGLPELPETSGQGLPMSGKKQALSAGQVLEPGGVLSDNEDQELESRSDMHRRFAQAENGPLQQAERVLLFQQRKQQGPREKAGNQEAAQSQTEQVLGKGLQQALLECEALLEAERERAQHLASFIAFLQGNNPSEGPGQGRPSDRCAICAQTLAAAGRELRLEETDFAVYGQRGGEGARGRLHGTGNWAGQGEGAGRNTLHSASGSAPGDGRQVKGHDEPILGGEDLSAPQEALPQKAPGEAILEPTSASYEASCAASRSSVEPWQPGEREPACQLERELAAAKTSVSQLLRDMEGLQRLKRATAEMLKDERMKAALALLRAEELEQRVQEETARAEMLQVLLEAAEERAALFQREVEALLVQRAACTGQGAPHLETDAHCLRSLKQSEALCLAAPGSKACPCLPSFLRPSRAAPSQLLKQPMQGKLSLTGGWWCSASPSGNPSPLAPLSGTLPSSSGGTEDSVLRTLSTLTAPPAQPDASCAASLGAVPWFFSFSSKLPPPAAVAPGTVAAADAVPMVGTTISGPVAFPAAAPVAAPAPPPPCAPPSAPTPASAWLGLGFKGASPRHAALQLPQW